MQFSTYFSHPYYLAKHKEGSLNVPLHEPAKGPQKRQNERVDSCCKFDAITLFFVFPLS